MARVSRSGFWVVSGKAPKANKAKEGLDGERWKKSTNLEMGTTKWVDGLV